MTDPSVDAPRLTTMLVHAWVAIAPNVQQVTSPAQSNETNLLAVIAEIPPSLFEHLPGQARLGSVSSSVPELKIY
jgi:hypothetical protein